MKNYYSVLNECAVKNQVLFAGSTFAHDFPINELMQDFDVDARVYNRSEKGAKLADARDFVMEQAEALEPSKIFLCFGDEDIKAEGFLAGEFSYEYKELVSDIKKKFPDCQIYILPVMADGAEEADNALKNICLSGKAINASTTCLSNSLKSDALDISIFVASLIIL